jgi:hypothetical protein
MWGMNQHTNLQPWMFAPIAAVVFSCWAGVFCAVVFLISRISGWSLLARRFRAQEEFCGESWDWQSARWRGWCNYNNCLTVGANQEFLYLSMMPIMLPLRLSHPELVIPWQEIEVEAGKMFFGWYDTATFRIGTQERVTVRIYGKLVRRVRQAAGPGWPLYHMEQMDAQTRGVGKIKGESSWAGGYWFPPWRRKARREDGGTRPSFFSIGHRHPAAFGSLSQHGESS